MRKKNILIVNGDKKTRINSRNKGQRFERSVVKHIATELGIEEHKHIRRTPNSGALTTRADVWVSATQREKFPFFCELKNREDLQIDKPHSRTKFYEIYVKACKARDDDPEYPSNSPVLLIFTRNLAGTYVMISDSDLNVSFNDKQKNYLIDQSVFYLKVHIEGVIFNIFSFNEFVSAYRYVMLKGVL